MQNISETLLAIMENSHCNSMTALLRLGGNENVSDTLRLSKPVSDTNTADNQGSRQERGRPV